MNRAVQLILYVTTFAACASTVAIVRCEAAEVRYRDTPAELAINQISERTVQIVLAPLDESTGEPRPMPPSGVTVELQPQEKLRRRRLEAAEQIAVGPLRIEVKAEPLTITVRRASGEVVQTLTFDAT